MESLLNNVLIACQLCLGLWQFSKLTRVGALIQGAFGWLVRPLGLSPTYSRLQPCEGRVFKRANCFVLQAGIPSDRSAISRPEVNTMNLRYLGTDFLLERKGELFINDKMYPEFSHTKKKYPEFSDTIWEELQNLEKILLYALQGPHLARAVFTSFLDARAAHERTDYFDRDAAYATRAAADATADAAARAAEIGRAHV